MSILSPPFEAPVQARFPPVLCAQGQCRILPLFPAGSLLSPAHTLPLCRADTQQTLKQAGPSWALGPGVGQSRSWGSSSRLEKTHSLTASCTLGPPAGWPEPLGWRWSSRYPPPPPPPTPKAGLATRGTPGVQPEPRGSCRDWNLCGVSQRLGPRGCPQASQETPAAAFVFPTTSSLRKLLAGPGCQRGRGVDPI